MGALHRWLCTYRHSAEDVARRSISVDMLLHFYHVVVRGIGYNPAELKTREVVWNIVVPVTADDVLSWVDSMRSRGGADAMDTADPGITHVVHAWGMRFNELLMAVLRDAVGGEFRGFGSNYDHSRDLYHDALRRRYWICCFCINQHRSICGEATMRCTCGGVKHNETSPRCEYDKFEAVAGRIHRGGGRMIVVLEKEMMALNRAWCVDEIHYALHSKMPLRLQVTTIPQMVHLREYQCDVDACLATFEADRLRIVHKVERGVGISKFNAALTQFVRKEAEALVHVTRQRARSRSQSSSCSSQARS